MKKIFSVFVLMSCFMSSAFALECETLVTGGWRFGCDSEDQGADKEYSYGDTVQTVGAAWCANHSGESSTKYYNMRFTCTDTSGQHDDWQDKGPNYCSDTQFEETQIDNARYVVMTGGTECESVDSWDDSVNSNGCQGGCLKVTCKLGYAQRGNNCVPVESVATCTESSVLHGGSVAVGAGVAAAACSTSGGSYCLKTGNNTFLYCYTKDDLKTRPEDELPNSCIAYKHRVRIPSQPREYFECAGDGKWKKHTFKMCESGSDFPAGCDGIDGCVEQIVDDTGNKVVVDASATAQNLVMNSGNTFCVRAVCKDGWVKSGEKCITNSAAQKQRQDAANRNKINAENKKKCEDSFGSWANGTCQCDADKNLTNETNVSCKCIDARYERNPQNKKCEFTSIEVRKQKCEAASSYGAVWNGTECKCSEPNKIWSGTQCVYPEGFEQCKSVQGAKWDNGSCVCKDSTKELDATRTKCVDSEETIRKRKVVTAQSSITSAVGKLENIVDGLDVSKWKTEDGNFNTARLASDSIAGVVLGTAGGLITSSVVKKHQVEDGFEDLQCTIGGQTVANWGDEFQVGVR